MPHASEDGGAGAGGEDACSSDELIVFKDEDGGEDVVKRSSDKVTEEKSDLIDLSESEVKPYAHAPPRFISKKSFSIFVRLLTNGGAGNEKEFSLCTRFVRV